MNPLIADIPPSLIRSIAARKRPGDIDLGLGEPTLSPDIAPFEAALEWTRRHGSPYSPNAGFPELREGIAGYLNYRGAVDRAHHSRASAPLAPANICVTIGSEEALYLAIKTVVDPARDEVLIVEPCYLAYPKICMLEGIRQRMIPLSGDERFQPRASMVLDEVRSDTRLIIINTPCNPTGRVWPEDELRALADGLKNRGGREIFVLADEVYRELYFGDEPPASIADFHPSSLIAGSLSKSSSLTGLRIGWLAGPEAVISAATKVHQFVNTAASTFAQRVGIELFADPSNLSRNRAAYTDARAVLLAAAEGAGLDLIPPEGAFYALIRLPGPLGADSLGFAERLIEEKRVVTVPGRAFGESAEGWLRISWVAPVEDVAEGLRRIGKSLSGPSRVG